MVSSSAFQLFGSYAALGDDIPPFRDLGRDEGFKLFGCGRGGIDTGLDKASEAETLAFCEKLFAEETLRYYAEQYNMRVRIARFHNIYGPWGTWKGGREKAPAAFCRKILAAEKEFEMWGDGKQTRDYVFVGDVVDLYLRIGENLARNANSLRGRVYNAGTNQPRAVRDVLETVFRLTCRQADFNAVLEMMKGRETVGEIECQYMDYELVNRDFGWAPQHSFDSGVALTIER